MLQGSIIGLHILIQALATVTCIVESAGRVQCVLLSVFDTNIMCDGHHVLWKMAATAAGIGTRPKPTDGCVNMEAVEEQETAEEVEGIGGAGRGE